LCSAQTSTARRAREPRLGISGRAARDELGHRPLPLRSTSIVEDRPRSRVVLLRFVEVRASGGGVRRERTVPGCTVGRRRSGEAGGCGVCAAARPRTLRRRKR
jgi:hypothetical protein